MISWLKDLFKSENVVKWDKPLPYVEGYKDTNSIKKGTQRREVIEHLVYLGSITSIEAIDMYGITRLASHIHKLKGDYGLSIIGEWQYHPTKNVKWKIYKLKKETKNV